MNLPPDAQKAIEKAADRGNDVEIRKKGGGYIILEVSKKIIYRSSDREGPEKDCWGQLPRFSRWLAPFYLPERGDLHGL